MVSAPIPCPVRYSGVGVAYCCYGWAVPSLPRDETAPVAPGAQPAGGDGGATGEVRPTPGAAAAVQLREVPRIASSRVRATLARTFRRRRGVPVRRFIEAPFVGGVTLDRCRQRCQRKSSNDTADLLRVEQGLQGFQQSLHVRFCTLQPATVCLQVSLDPWMFRH